MHNQRHQLCLGSVCYSVGSCAASQLPPTWGRVSVSLESRQAEYSPDLRCTRGTRGAESGQLAWAHAPGAKAHPPVAQTGLAAFALALLAGSACPTFQFPSRCAAPAVINTLPILHIVLAPSALCAYSTASSGCAKNSQARQEPQLIKREKEKEPLPVKGYGNGARQGYPGSIYYFFFSPFFFLFCPPSPPHTR